MAMLRKLVAGHLRSRVIWAFALLLVGSAHALAQGTIQQSGAATAGHGLCFVQNGIARDCGYAPASAAPGACPLRIVASGTSDIATTADCSVAWNSATAAAKTEFLYACITTTKSNVLYVSDEKGTASSDYPITVSPSGSNTIANLPAYYLYFAGQSQRFQCDGAGNWILQ